MNATKTLQALSGENEVIMQLQTKIANYELIMQSEELVLKICQEESAALKTNMPPSRRP
jgi:hypothetical protein